MDQDAIVACSIKHRRGRGFCLQRRNLLARVLQQGPRSLIISNSRQVPMATPENRNLSGPDLHGPRCACCPGVAAESAQNNATLTVHKTCTGKPSAYTRDAQGNPYRSQDIHRLWRSACETFKCHAHKGLPSQKTGSMVLLMVCLRPYQRVHSFVSAH